LIEPPRSTNPHSRARRQFVATLAVSVLSAGDAAKALMADAQTAARPLTSPDPD
jgi:hypothetical protein